MTPEGLMGTKLLLADDSITIQKVVGIIFSNEDYELTVVGDGTHALEKARESIPAIMLVDAIMPGRNGYEVCQEVRADATLKNIPLLLMTGAFEPFDENMARECGADDFISKPFESQQLVGKVKALLEIGKQRSAAASQPVTVTPYIQPSEQDFEATLADPWDEPAQEVVAPFAPIPEMFDDSFIGTESAEFDSGTVATLEPLSNGLEVIEAAPGDDPWGVFDLIDLEEPTTLPEIPSDVAELEPEESHAAAPYGEQAFKEITELESPLQVAVSEEFETKWEHVEEEVFNYQFEEPTPTGDAFAVGLGEPLAMLANEPEQFSVMDVFEPESEIVHEELLAPVEMAEASPEPVPTAAIGEDQLRAILSQISRDVIEKIVWEVVPDLAENLIREEIRKIKQGLMT
jgi:CheY-like chemotaxis protein